MLRRPFPADRLIHTLETKRVELKATQIEQDQNPKPGLELEYLIGSAGDRQRIIYVGKNHDHPVGRYEPLACRQAADAIGRQFEQQLLTIRTGSFGRIYFSQVGQRQLLELIFHALMPTRPGVEPVQVVEAWATDFNAVLQASVRGEQRLFDPDAEWNAPEIRRLGTHGHVQRHVGGLLRLST